MNFISITFLVIINNVESNYVTIEDKIMNYFESGK